MVPQPITERQALPPPPRRLDEHWIGEHPLADEHAVLLHEVRIRGQRIRAALSEGRWPDHEVAGLVDYLRYEVLDQAVNTERLLFPLVGHGRTHSGIHQLVDDHVRLRDLADRLANVATAHRIRSEPGDLVELLDALEEFLDRHMRTEESLLSGTTSAGVESLRRPFRCHLWFPLTEGPGRPRRPSAGIRPPGGTGAVLPAPAGREALLRSGRELDGLWNLLSSGRPGDYGWAYLEEGPERWRAEVTRRAPE